MARRPSSSGPTGSRCTRSRPSGCSSTAPSAAPCRTPSIDLPIWRSRQPSRRSSPPASTRSTRPIDRSSAMRRSSVRASRWPASRPSASSRATASTPASVRSSGASCSSTSSIRAHPSAASTRSSSHSSARSRTGPWPSAIDGAGTWRRRGSSRVSAKMSWPVRSPRTTSPPIAPRPTTPRVRRSRPRRGSPCAVRPNGRRSPRQPRPGGHLLPRGARSLERPGRPRGPARAGQGLRPTPAATRRPPRRDSRRRPRSGMTSVEREREARAIGLRGRAVVNGWRAPAAIAILEPALAAFEDLGDDPGPRPDRASAGARVLVRRRSCPRGSARGSRPRSRRAAR